MKLKHVRLSILISHLFLGLFALVACKPEATTVPTQEQIDFTATITDTAPTKTPSQPTATSTPTKQAPTETAIPTHTSPPTATPTPTPPPIPIGGVELHRITAHGGLDLLSQTNTHWIRYNGLMWSSVENEVGERNWEAVESFEQELINASDQGFQVVLIVRHAPVWARQARGKPCSAITPESIDTFANFMHDAVARYSLPPYNIKYWELGNEPDVYYKLVSADSPFGCWGDPDDQYYGGGYYTEMLKAVYPRIKDADAQAQVLIGGLLMDCDPISPPETSPGSGEYKDCTPATFIEGVLQNEGGDYFDGVSFHAYDYYYGQLGIYGNPNWHSSSETTGPALSAKIEYVKYILDSYGYGDKFLMNTEISLLCGEPKSPVCQSDEFNQTKANYLAQSYAAARAGGLMANIWYSITGWSGSGLTEGNMQPVPAFDAYGFNLDILHDASFSDEISDYPLVKGYEFNNQGKSFWFLWSLDESPQTITLPAQPSAIYDVFGNPISTDIEIIVTQNPIYIEWES